MVRLPQEQDIFKAALARGEKLNRDLDLRIAIRCSKALPGFTRRYILTSRSSVASRSFDRLIKAGVITISNTRVPGSLGTVYNFNHEGFQRWKQSIGQASAELEPKELPTPMTETIASSASVID